MSLSIINCQKRSQNRFQVLFLHFSLSVRPVAYLVFMLLILGFINEVAALFAGNHLGSINFQFWAASILHPITWTASIDAAKSILQHQLGFIIALLEKLNNHHIN